MHTTPSIEVSAYFPDLTSFESGVDELLCHGFDHCDLSVLGSTEQSREPFRMPWRSVEALESDPGTPRAVYVARESLGDAEGAVISASVYIPAMIGAAAAVASGGTVLAAAGAAALAGGLGGTLGAGFAWGIGHRHSERIAEQIRRGGLLLWVDAPTPEAADKAAEILARQGATTVHRRRMSEVPEATAEERYEAVIDPKKRIPY